MFLSDQLTDDTGRSPVIAITSVHDRQVTPEEQRLGLTLLVARRQREKVEVRPPPRFSRDVQCLAGVRSQRSGRAPGCSWYLPPAASRGRWVPQFEPAGRSLWAVSECRKVPDFQAPNNYLRPDEPKDSID